LDTTISEEQLPPSEAMKPEELKEKLPAEVWDRLNALIQKHKEVLQKRKIPYTPPVNNPPPVGI
jgi:hypothetical protein